MDGEPIHSGEGGIPPVILPAAGPSLRPRWAWYLHLVLLVSYPLVLGVLSVSGTGHSAPALSNSVKGLVFISVFELGTFGALFGVAWLFSRCSAALLYLTRFRPMMILQGLGYSIGIRFGVGIVAAFIAGAVLATGLISQNDLMDLIMKNRPRVEALVDVKFLAKNPVYMILSATLVSFVVAGLREELWRAGVLAGLRVLWPKRFESTRGQIVGIALAAVAFGLGHIAQGWLAVGVTGLLGLFLGAIMVLHKSIWPAVIAHGAFNAATFVALPWVIDTLPV